MAGVENTALAVILIGGLVITFLGVNIYRYAVMIMGGGGGFVLGKIVYDNFVAGWIGQGVLRESDSSAAGSFVIAVFVFGGVFLGYALYNIMGILIAAVGGAFMFAKGMQVLLGVDILYALIGAVVGAFVGALVSAMALKMDGRMMIVFMSLAGARMVGYAGSILLSTTSFGATIAKPFAGWFSHSYPQDAVSMVIFLELFIVVFIIGMIGQTFIRE